eukprot:scaffold238108_cov15-Tisochrysis_lutea.AAC.1
MTPRSRKLSTIAKVRSPNICKSADRLASSHASTGQPCTGQAEPADLEDHKGLDVAHLLL